LWTTTPRIRRLIASIVLPFASEIRECAESADALTAYQAQRPDLVLMDICMNEVDGISAVEQIRAADPAAKIVIVTNYDDNALRQATMRAGACGYVLKDSLLELRQWFETST
jgi:DNA-binding NarL/FixJ family response regulator